MSLPFEVHHNAASGQTFIFIHTGERKGQTKLISPPWIGEFVWALWQEYQTELDHSHKLETDLESLVGPP